MNTKNFRHKKRPQQLARGFSLIELIAVIVLLGIIAGVVAPQVLGKADQGKWNATKVKVQKVAASIEAYAIDNGNVPNRLEDLISAPGGADGWAGPYARASDLKDGWNKEFIYKAPGEHGDFDLMSYAKDGQPGGERWGKDIGNWE